MTPSGNGHLDLVEMEKWSGGELSVAVRAYYKNGDGATAAQRAFRRQYDIPPRGRILNGDKEAPILTIFIGGNHEASNYLQELPYGGWVAPNIYYMGYSCVLNVAGIRVGGISGIYKSHDYLKGRNEKTPYDNDAKRSVYHIRNLDVFRLKQIKQPLDIFISHDWPHGIWNYGNSNRLLKFKPYFREDMETGKLGSKPCEELLRYLRPSYYFAAHLHCKFAALFEHGNKRTTKFLALDKCLPNKRFLQIIDIRHDTNLKIELKYDLEWLTILFLTNHLISIKSGINYMPSSTGSTRWQFAPTEEEKTDVSKKFSENLVVPLNFVKTAKGHASKGPKRNYTRQPKPKINPQTVFFCKTLNVDDPLVLLGAIDESDNRLESSVSDDSTAGESESYTDIYETFIGTTPIKLNLPEPKSERHTSSDLSAIVKSASILGDLSEKKEVAIVVEGECTPSHPKKFKGRNASLYTNDSG